MSLGSFKLETEPMSVQRIAPQSASEGFEGIGFSPSGNVIGIAAANSNAILLFRKKADGRFEDVPYWKIEGPLSRLNYPHDVSFSACGDADLLAVAQRAGAIAIYKKNRDDETYGPEPLLEIRGKESRLSFSDGVAFVPPDNAYLAACNLTRATICFYRRQSLSPLRFQATPEFELSHWSVYRPDGLAFSACGRWFACANHGVQSVSVFRRCRRMFSGSKLRYGPRPVTVIRDPTLHYPHSVAFTPHTNHLVVTNAGANYFNVYEPRRGYFGMGWSQSPVVQRTVGADEIFRRVNAENKMEGGPKGVAIHDGTLAVCNPEFGIEIHSFREVPGAQG